MNEKLIAFMFVLLRDHLTFGQVEEIFLKHLDGVVSFSFNGSPHMVDYVKGLVKRLEN